MIRKILNSEIKKYGNFNTWWGGGVRGDYSSNVGDPQLAEKIKEELSGNKYISKIETEKGFVNFFLSDEALEEALHHTQGKFNYGKDKIQVEFISANPTGPLTLGNGRGGVYGDVLANILKEAGNDVTKEYYVNDAGNQINILGHSVLKDDKAVYKGEYIDEIAKNNNEKNPDVVGHEASKVILEGIKKTVTGMGIEFDTWFSEAKELREKGKVEEVIKWLKEKGLAYEGDGALWFKASEYGDGEDRVLVKTNGEYTYFCVDCAYHFNKFKERKFEKVINIWGTDHHGDVARVKGFAEALGFKDNLEIILLQFVRLVENGKTSRMSKREGNFVLVDEVLREINKDAFRYFMLTHSPNTHMDFDLEMAKEQSKKNPVYYVQYAHARACSILAKSKIQNSKSQINQKLQILNSKQERELILKLIQYPEIIEDTAKDYQVQRMTTYVYELAKTFTGFYENVKVIEAETEELKEARLGLVAVAGQVLKHTLGLMKISAPEKM